MREKEKKDPLADSWMRVHLIDEEPFVLGHVQVKYGNGYVTGRRAEGGEVAYPSWRIKMLEAVNPVGDGFAEGWFQA